jgi:hypothetical protein
MDLKVGDWVTAYKPGIWRIYRVLNYKSRDPLTRAEATRTTIFSKRFLSKTFKPSSGEECCDPSFVGKLSEKCIQQGLRDDEFLVRAIAPQNDTVIDAKMSC